MDVVSFYANLDENFSWRSEIISKVTRINWILDFGFWILSAEKVYSEIHQLA